MLLRFGCQNFRSISSYQEILFTASPRKDDSEGLIFSSNATKEQILPIIALYGANGSGKTNLLKALCFFTRFITGCSQNDLSGFNIPKFKLNNELVKSEQSFDIDIIVKGIHYHYGFKILSDEIVEEWLYSFSYVNRTSRSVLFHRDEREDEPYHFGKNLKGQNKNIGKITNKHTLFLSVAAKSNHDLLETIFVHFDSQFNFRFNLDINEERIAKKIQKFGLEEDISNFISKVDIGAECIKTSQVKVDSKQLEMRSSLKSALDNIFSSNEFKIDSKEPEFDLIIEVLRKDDSGEAVSFSFSEESLGTRALISLLVIILRALKTGGTLIVDELESSLHTLLSLKLVELFNSKHTNPNQAQLIFSTHETQLLNFNNVRRDQIWFTERCPDGSSHIAPLTDYKVPKNANLRNGYLNGKFGAIPYLDSLNFESLFTSAESNV
jgi:AAA15 family ATPase/GTPase